MKASFHCKRPPLKAREPFSKKGLKRPIKLGLYDNFEIKFLEHGKKKIVTRLKKSTLTGMYKCTFVGPQLVLLLWLECHVCGDTHCLRIIKDNICHSQAFTTFSSWNGTLTKANFSLYFKPPLYSFQFMKLYSKTRYCILSHCLTQFGSFTKEESYMRLKMS